MMLGPVKGKANRNLYLMSSYATGSREEAGGYQWFPAEVLNQTNGSTY